jgi:hypothetical protein
MPVYVGQCKIKVFSYLKRERVDEPSLAPSWTSPLIPATARMQKKSERCSKKLFDYLFEAWLMKKSWKERKKEKKR